MDADWAGKRDGVKGSIRSRITDNFKHSLIPTQKKNISFSTNSEATICLFVIPDQGFFFSVQMSFHSMAHESQTFKIRKFYHVLHVNFCKYIDKKTGSDQLSVIFLACTWWNYLLFYAHSSEYLGYFQLDLIKKSTDLRKLAIQRRLESRLQNIFLSKMSWSDAPVDPIVDREKIYLYIWTGYIYMVSWFHFDTKWRDKEYLGGE